MKLLSLAWNFIPAPARIWVVLGLVVVVVVALGVAVYKIDKNGYDRCEANYAAAALELKNKSREEIIKSGKKYDKIKTEIAKVKGADDVVGPRVELAIDRMPGSPDSE